MNIVPLALIVGAIVLTGVILLIVAGTRKEPQQADEDPQSQSQEASTEESAVPAAPEESAEESGEASEDVPVVPAVQVLQRPSILRDYFDLRMPVVSAKVDHYTIEANLSNVYNLEAFYLNDEEVDLLSKNGFFVTSSYQEEFFSVYEGNRYEYIPNFVTVDSMMHTYHLYFAHLMKTTEKEYLTGNLVSLSAAMQRKAYEQYEALKGTEWEKAALMNLGFFAVGRAVLDPEATVPDEVKDVVNEELELIQQMDGIHPSPMFGLEEDYSQYKPRGYYDTDEGLSRYFQAMMWYGRRNFQQKEEDQDRAALLMTLALDDETLPMWEAIYTVTAFFAGVSDDSGYYEYYPAIETAYGKIPSLDDLTADPAGWEAFHELTAQMEPPKINSIPVYMSDSDEEKAEKILGYRFMGQRFTLDASIFTQLCYRNVTENEAGDVRMLPDALDVPAAMGSDEALAILEEQGDTGFKGYTDHMQALRDTIAAAEEDTWQVSLYAGWLNTLRPLLEPKGEGYPFYMQSSEWTRKNLQTFLGSYTELKHDTILYAKQMMAEMGGGGELIEWDDRGYVEAEPEVFARLSALVRATSDGLDHYGLIHDEDKESLAILAELADRLQTIAEKELSDELLTDDEYDLIRTYGGQLEHFWEVAMRDEGGEGYISTKEFPAPVVADIATDPNGFCLEVGTGRPSVIYVLIEVDGKVKIARGTVYSFYQFVMPIDQRLTDKQWRQMIGVYGMDEDYTITVEKPDRPAWTDTFWENEQ